MSPLTEAELGMLNARLLNLLSDEHQMQIEIAGEMGKRGWARPASRIFSSLSPWVYRQKSPLFPFKIIGCVKIEIHY